MPSVVAINDHGVLIKAKAKPNRERRMHPRSEYQKMSGYWIEPITG